MTLKINQISKLLSHLAIIFFLLRATFFNEIIFTLIGILFGLSAFILQARIFHINKNVFIFIILSLFISIITFYNNAFSRGLIFFPMIISGIGIAWSFYKNGLNHKFVLVIFYFLVFYYLIKILLFGYYPGEIFSNSRNHISAMFINLFSLIVISSNINRLNINFIHCLTLLICCILAVGISGILVSTFIFITFLQYKYFFKIVTKYISLTVILNLLFVLIIVILWPFIQSFVQLNFEADTDIAIKYAKPLIDIFRESSRILIINDYINLSDLKSFVFGNKLDLEINNLKNFHNSFIVLHVRAGIFFFGLIIFLIYAIIKNLRKDFMLGVCLLAITLRSFTDTTLFSGYHYEYIFIYLLLFSYKQNLETADERT
tara:strand:- start:41 stop:1162 length:1122 start_codon:yes stop_codon:yes gene_type:complete